MQVMNNKKGFWPIMPVLAVLGAIFLVIIIYLIVRNIIEFGLLGGGYV